MSPQDACLLIASSDPARVRACAGCRAQSFLPGVMMRTDAVRGRPATHDILHQLQGKGKHRRVWSARLCWAPSGRHSGARCAHPCCDAPGKQHSGTNLQCSCPPRHPARVQIDPAVFRETGEERHDAAPELAEWLDSVRRLASEVPLMIRRTRTSDFTSTAMKGYEHGHEGVCASNRPIAY